MSTIWNGGRNQTFLETLREQRWDDHRFYHQSRINQSLHFVSACSFVVAMGFLATGHAAIATLIGWLVGMLTRQSGHFFFEPRDYDHVNQVTDEYKEEVKVGYNIRRKVVLMTVWALAPVVLWFQPTLFGLFHAHTDFASFAENAAILWLWISLGAVLLRTVHLFFIRDVQSGLAWFTKIATDPFHDIQLYYKAPLALLRGELIDPMHKARGVQQA